ncbi:hypothetical protein TNCV_5054411 [Trichonephila clavipes]|nr:hypothetical protein TNCV_5054411 [Trichonephila clavipes]
MSESPPPSHPQPSSSSSGTAFGRAFLKAVTDDARNSSAAYYTPQGKKREKRRGKKISRAPRERETRTHLKKVSFLRGTGPGIFTPEIIEHDSNDEFGKMEKDKFESIPPKKEKLTHSEERLKLLKQIAERKVAPQNEPDKADLILDLW